MAKPIVIETFPSNKSVDVPVGVKIAITFDRAIDLKSARDNIVIYGRDFDLLSGPETATWMHEGDALNPLFLRSPEFKGIVDYTLEAVYVDPTTGKEIELTDVTDVTVEEYANVYQKLLIIPKDLLAEKCEFYVYIIGEVEDNINKGLSKRTVYEPDYNLANSEEAKVFVYGGYTGSIDDQLNIKVTKEGNIGEAEFKYWYSSEKESDAVKGKITSRRFRKLSDGLQIRFSGSNFLKDDIYTVKLYTKEFLEKSYSLNFKTSSDFIEDVPDTMSTSPIGTKLLEIEESGGLELTDMIPEDGGTHQSFSDKTIVLTFDKELDSDTVTDATVTVYAYPVSGSFTGNRSAIQEPTELRKKLTVEENKIIIEV